MSQADERSTVLSSNAARAASTAMPCPTCGTVGQVVSTNAVLTHLHSSAISKYQPGQAHHFCINHDCRTVYYAPAQVFVLEDMAARVYGKEDGPDVNVCPCYRYSSQHLKQHGWKVLSELEARIKRGVCWCDISNVSGQPCLNEVRFELLRLHLPSRQVTLDNPTEQITPEQVTPEQVTPEQVTPEESNDAKSE